MVSEGNINEFAEQLTNEQDHQKEKHFSLEPETF